MDTKTNGTNGDGEQLKLKVGLLAMEKMREIDEQVKRERMNTKQKRGTPTRDINLQSKVFNWIMETTNERPPKSKDYDAWIQEGIILIKVLHNVWFNSVPLEMVMPQMKELDSKEERLKLLKKYLKKFGVPDEYLFTESDLFELKNVPKVTRCFAMLGRLAGIERFQSVDLDIPDEESLENLTESDEEDIERK